MVEHLARCPDSDPRGQYRSRHAAAPRTDADEAGRMAYVGSAKKLERQYAEGLERTKKMLDQQRKELQESKRRAEPG
jgi:hypothetical protein